MIEQISAALERRTRSFHDEIALHGEIAAALHSAGLPFEQEVQVGTLRVDFVISGTLAVEVKTKGNALGVLRQIFRYLEDPRFTAGLILTVKHFSLPADHYERADGSIIPVHKIELWKNAL